MRKIKKILIACPENNYNPPVLSYKAFIIYGMILLLLRLMFGFIQTQGSAVDSEILMRLINKERGSRNLTVLSRNSSLLTASAGKAQDMIDRDYFAHIDPDGNYVWGKITSAGYAPYRILGENLALDFSASEGLVQAWLDSPTHRANILHKEFLDQGLSALYGDYQGRYTNLTASLFGTLAAANKPSGQVKSTPPPPTPPAPPPSPQPGPTDLPVSALSEVNWFNLSTPFAASRVIFTIFGLFLLFVLLIDSVIIFRHQRQIARSYSSYHLSTFVFIVLVSILIWWW